MGILITKLLTLGAHAPQGYSSCVCVSGSIFPNSNEWPGRSMDRLSAALDLKRGFFRKTVSREDTEFEWQPYWHTSQPFWLLSQAPERISIHVTLLSTTWCFVRALSLCLAMVWCNAI